MSREINPPASEPVPVPTEALEGGLNVKVLEPKRLHLVAQNIITMPRRFRETISTTRIDDSLLTAEESHLWAFGSTEESDENIDPTFYFDSFLELSPERIGQEDNGYFSDDEVQRVQAALTERGVDATSSIKIGGRNVITVEKDGQYVEVYFGFPNRKAEEDSIREEVEAARRSKPNKPGWVEKHQLPRIEKGLTNSSICLALLSKERSQSGRLGYLTLEDQKSFTRAATLYAYVYQQVVNAIYQEEGVTPPDASIILRLMN